MYCWIRQNQFTAVTSYTIIVTTTRTMCPFFLRTIDCGTSLAKLNLISKRPLMRHRPHLWRLEREERAADFLFGVRNICSGPKR